MNEEILPILKEENGCIRITGKAARNLAHSVPPVLHATSVIAACLPDGRILFADKTEKQRAKGHLSVHENAGAGARVLDIFGGHLLYDDLSEEDLACGLSEQTYRKCAARELSEELLFPDSQGVPHPLQVDENRLILLGLYRMENDHNKELSAAWLYPLEKTASYSSVDTLFRNGKELTFPQPIVYLSPEEAIRQYFNPAASCYVFDDAFGRIVCRDHGKSLLSELGKMQT